MIILYVLLVLLVAVLVSTVTSPYDLIIYYIVIHFTKIVCPRLPVTCIA